MMASYFIGPYSYTFCHLDNVMKNALSTKIPIMLTFIVVIRYIFIFHAKNPTGLQDEFWTLFLEMWSIGKCNFIHLCRKGSSFLEL